MSDTIKMIVPDGNGEYGMIDTGIQDPFDGAKNPLDIRRSYEKIFGVIHKDENAERGMNVTFKMDDETKYAGLGDTITVMTKEQAHKIFISDSNGTKDNI